MKRIETLYNLLAIHHKIPDRHLRFLYLKDIWGLDQVIIGELEGGMSQSQVSVVLKQARSTIPHLTVVHACDIEFSDDEIKYLQFLPRDILSDVQIIAFVNDILGINVVHPFYTHFDHSPRFRIAALISLGVQHKRLVSLFKKSQPAISMIAKRYEKKILELERNNRYDETARFHIEPQKRTNNFIVAGGN